jgi:hypothetical protein
MGSGKSRIDVRKLRARCRHFRFASRSQDDWRRLGHPQPPRSPTPVLHLHLETSSENGSQPLSRLCIRAFCGHNNVPTRWGRRGKCGTPQRSVWERGETGDWGCTRGGCVGEKSRNKRSESTIPDEEMERSRPKRESHYYQRLPETSIQRPAHLRSPNFRSETRGDSHPSADHRVRFSSRKLHFSTGSLRFHV